MRNVPVLVRMVVARLQADAPQVRHENAREEQVVLDERQRQQVVIIERPQEPDNKANSNAGKHENEVRLLVRVALLV